MADRVTLRQPLCTSLLRLGGSSERWAGCLPQALPCNMKHIAFGTESGRHAGSSPASPVGAPACTQAVADTGYRMQDLWYIDAKLDSNMR